MKKLLIIDGNAMVHRAFHAFPALTRQDGQLVNAVYGFFSILIKALAEVKPTNLVICFDRPAPTFRKQLYTGYQAHRPKMADELSEQFLLLHDALIQVGIPIYEVDGYEADDIIGTISLQAKQQQIQSVILSGDRDLLQLVNEWVTMIAPIVGITKMIYFNEETVREKYGVKPSQVTDYKALVGDASDGYPGVQGIGPKTAITLINKYGSFENLYEHISELPEKIALKLATDAEQAALAKKLATIMLDVPVHLDVSSSAMEGFTRDKIEIVCDTFNFSSLKKRLHVFPEMPFQKIDSAGTGKDQLELI